MSDDEFAEQLRLEALEQQNKAKDAEQRTYVDKDGTTYEWDIEKRAWFPKIDADFMAQYQMNYGGASESAASDPASTTQSADSSQQTGSTESGQWWPDPNSPGYAEWYYANYGAYHQSQRDVDASASSLTAGPAVNSNTDTSKDQPSESNEDPKPSAEKRKAEDDNEEDQDKKKKKKRPPPKPPAWFDQDEQHNTSVYVSGLPSDITDKEFEEFMAKCGMIALDPQKHQLKLKLYKDEDGNLKGDGRCCYIKMESVDLALQILDGSMLKDKLIKVQKAEFKMKGDFDAKKARRKLTNKQKKKLKEKQQKLFDWRLHEGSRDTKDIGNEAPPTLFL